MGEQTTSRPDKIERTMDIYTSKSKANERIVESDWRDGWYLEFTNFGRKILVM